MLSLVSAALMLIFIVPPLARSARLEVKRFDLPVEVTSGGGIFLIILVVVALPPGTPATIFCFWSFRCSVPVVCRQLAARASLRDLIVSARFPDHIFAGEAAPVIVTLRNAKRVLPSFSILVEARGPVERRAETTATFSQTTTGILHLRSASCRGRTTSGAIVCQTRPRIDQRL